MISDQNSRKNVTKLINHIYKHQPQFDLKKFALEELEQIKNSFSGIRPTLNVFNHPVNDMLTLFMSTCEGKKFNSKYIN